MRRIRTLVFTALIFAGSSALGQETSAASQVAVQTGQAGTPVDTPRAPVSFDNKSDIELTEIARRWNELDPMQRDALIAEVKSRMARRGARDGVLRIQLTRRYGRVVHGSTGATLRIERVERRVVPVAPEGQVATNESRPGFGAGFERREAKRGVVTVKGQPAQEQTPSNPSD